MKGRQIFPKRAARCFGLTFLALLAACAAPTSNEEAPAVQVPTSTEVAPAPTNTPEPMPTEVVEYPAPEREQLENGLFRAVRDAGCELEYETAYDPQGFYFPWTVDSEGNIVQGLVEMDLCGDGMSAPYVLFFEEGNAGHNATLVIGKYDIGVWWSPDFSLPPQVVGFLPLEHRAALKEAFLCVSGLKQLGFTTFYPAMVVSASTDVVKALNLLNVGAFAIGGDHSPTLTNYADCG